MNCWRQYLLRAGFEVSEDSYHFPVCSLPFACDLRCQLSAVPTAGLCSITMELGRPGTICSIKHFLLKFALVMVF